MKAKSLKVIVIAIIIVFLICIIFLALLKTNNQDSAGTDTGIFKYSTSADDSSIRFDSILNQIDNWVNIGEVVGAELLVIENREIVVHETFGWMNKEEEIPMKKNTIFRIRSMTKPFIATSALMLAEEGKLHLSDPVSKFLPSFDNPSSEAVTIEQLLTHTGGFDQPGFPRDYETYNSLREVVDDIGTHGPRFEPGTRYIYSDAGVAVLGAVIAEVSGMPVEKYIEDKIIAPLEMSDTFCDLVEDEEIRDRISATYFREGNEYVKYWDSSEKQAVNYFRASGGMYSTPLDYAKFLYMWMNKGSIDSHRYLSEESVVNALTPGNFNDKYGYLWEIGDYFGHGGSDGTIAFAIPKKKLMVLYFTQSRATHTPEVVKAMVVREFGTSESQQYTRIHIDAENYDEYIGKYSHPQIDIVITTDGESLYVDTSDASKQLFYPASKDFFIHEIMDIQLSFIRDMEGNVISAVIHQRGENIKITKDS